MNYEICQILNIELGIVEKPNQAIIHLKYPNNYNTRIWHCIRVKRLKDNVVLCKNYTKTDKGDVLFIKIKHDKCIIITSLGEFDIDDLDVVNPIY